MLDNPYAVETLPVQDIDLIIPTRVAELDSNLVIAEEQLAIMESRIREMELDRSTLLVRAKELSITTDANWKIVESSI